MRKLIIPSALLSMAVCSLVQALLAQVPSQPRAAPPKTFDRDVTTFFASDARTHLSGERPAPGSKALASVTPQPSGGTATAAPATASAAGSGWSSIVSGDALVSEVKLLQPTISKSVSNIGEFKGGGYKRAREALSMLAVVMGVIAEYEGDVRWKDQAAAARDAFARAGMNTKVATDASFNEAKLRAQDLEGIVRGESANLGAPAEGAVTWSKVAALPPLMKRLEAAHDERLSKLTASKGDFDKNIDLVSHEAQIVALLGEVIQREGYEYSEDEAYKEYSATMKTSALEVIEAVKLKDYEKARKAVGGISQACEQCHGDFRS